VVKVLWLFFQLWQPGYFARPQYKNYELFLFS